MMLFNVFEKQKKLKSIQSFMKITLKDRISIGNEER